MLHVNINGYPYEVSFVHGETPRNAEGETEPGVRSTVADIYTYGVDGFRYHLSEGVSTCHPADNFCKATGRKMALTRALELFNKTVRTAIWQAYWQSQGKKFAKRAE